jgi:hypothetical protein
MSVQQHEPYRPENRVDVEGIDQAALARRMHALGAAILQGRPAGSSKRLTADEEQQVREQAIRELRQSMAPDGPRGPVNPIVTGGPPGPTGSAANANRHLEVLQGGEDIEEVALPSKQPAEPASTAIGPVFDNIPPELAALPNWVMWRLEPKPGKTKGTKVPFQPNGKHASTTNSATWNTFETCRAAYQRGGYSGIGFVFDGKAGEDGFCFVGVDFDHCIKDGKLVEPARSRIAQLKTYTEISVSGTGVHCIGRGRPGSTVKNEHIEIYSGGRFFTFTGAPLNGGGCGNVRAITAEVDALVGSKNKPQDPQLAQVAADFDIPAGGPAEIFKGVKLDGLGEATIEEIRDAAAFLSGHLDEHPEMLSSEGEWMNLARSFAHQAMRQPDQRAELERLLDEMSKKSPGYNKEDNAARFERYIAEASKGKKTRTITGFFEQVRALGWTPAGQANAGQANAGQANAGQANAGPADGLAGVLAEAKAAPPSGNLMQSSAEFVGNFVPPEYLIDGLLQRRFVYSLTSPTGGGKTSIALLIALHVALGLPLAGKEVEKGRVLIFVGENPDDVRARWIKLCEEMRVNPEDLDVFFMPFVLNLSADAVRKKIDAEAEKHGPFSLLIVDTSAAYYTGNDENDNVALGNHARMLRSFVDLPGGPVILVTCHPIKTPDMGNLLPRGGGAFLAEVDGNLVCVKDASTSTTEVTTHGKFRGPEFAPFSFKLIPGTSPKLVDAKGRSIWTVYAKSISTAEQDALDQAGTDQEDALLRIMHDAPGASMTVWATQLGWLLDDGKPNKVKVQRAIKSLVAAKLIKQERSRGPYALTKKGEKAVRAMAAEAAKERMGDPPQG